KLLEKVEEIGGAEAYLNALALDKDPQNPDPTPEWLANGELLRQSHLYRFAMIMIDYRKERELADEAGVEFEPSRQPISAGDNLGVQRLVEELPAQFNACYLVLLAWLSRMYEIQDWQADKPRRKSIEALASWPLMSMAVRPFLELASFFEIDRNRLFQIDSESLPMLPIHAQQLLQIYANPERSEEINVRMDYLAVRVLSDAADWASTQRDVISAADLTATSNEIDMIMSRLLELTNLAEFEKQFPFRVHGGFSSTMPDLTYLQSHPEAHEFQEDPTTLEPGEDVQPPLFKETLALRLRFSGWGVVQLATDPDPPYDEVGVTGTQMLHSADGDVRFNRDMFWQDHPDVASRIRRTPTDRLPAIGVNCADVSLVVTTDPVPGSPDSVANAGYVPLQIMQSTGAVQASGVQQTVEVQGFQSLLNLTPEEIFGDGRRLRVDLLEKNGIRPFLNGNNHLVWQDGEPLDPFILAVQTGPSNGSAQDDSQLVFQREIFNTKSDGQSLTFLEMSPLQRLFSARGPVGFDPDLNHIPEWAKDQLSPEERSLLFNTGYPITYLTQRACVLADDLYDHVTKIDGRDQLTQSDVDAIVSLAERRRNVTIPRGTTVAWLTILLHYGHTVSGKVQLGEGDNPILTAIAERTNLNLRVGDGEGTDRKSPNSRWLAKYTQGVMDVDALSNLVFGEVFIPVTVKADDKPIEFHRRWTYPETMKSAVAEYACRFDSPFWGNFDPVSSGDRTRTRTLPDGTVITETEVAHDDTWYEYTISGIEGVSDFVGEFRLIDSGESDGEVTLERKVRFKCEQSEIIVKIASMIAQDNQQMTDKMTGHFSPGD
ncbi:MAG: hypothetical protein IIC24_06815, partial [Chloroflexi bacterium]|nr:hypothetical protein [Chloroflexota bacterium]